MGEGRCVIGPPGQVEVIATTPVPKLRVRIPAPDACVGPADLEACDGVERVDAWDPAAKRFVEGTSTKPIVLTAQWRRL